MIARSGSVALVVGDRFVYPVQNVHRSFALHNKGSKTHVRVAKQASDKTPLSRASDVVISELNVVWVLFIYC